MTLQCIVSFLSTYSTASSKFISDFKWQSVPLSSIITLIIIVQSFSDILADISIHLNILPQWTTCHTLPDSTCKTKIDAVLCSDLAEKFSGNPSQSIFFPEDGIIQMDHSSNILIYCWFNCSAVCRFYFSAKWSSDLWYYSQMVTLGQLNRCNTSISRLLRLWRLNASPKQSL